MKNNDKLAFWKARLSVNDSAYAGESAKMDEREAQYRGQRKTKNILRDDGDREIEEAPHIRNISAELIEAQTDAAIPQPKVTARRQKDEKLAKIIEDMLRCELDRMPMEQLNDMMERTVPIQGGGFWLVEWDNTQNTHTTLGEITVSTVHPKQVVPQDGVFTGIEDMDYIILKVPQTKEYIKKRYGVDVFDEGESEPDIKDAESEKTADDLVTQYIAYFRNDDGGIGLYSWVNDTELEDLDDYQARRVKKCAKCGISESEAVKPLQNPTIDGGYPGPEEKKSDKKVCPYCGGDKWIESNEDYEEVLLPIRTMSGVIPGMTQTQEAQYDELGNPIIGENGIPVTITVEQPTKIPYYKPDIYPIIIQKNVSVFGKFLGDSDLDKIADQQNTTNVVEQRIIDRLLQGGSYTTVPADRADIRVDPVIGKVIMLENAADKSLIGTNDLELRIDQELSYLGYIYEEARQVIGITDSFQGRQDSTATSGKAKEFAAAQSAGRLESKRIMKNAAFAALFEAIFKFKLAYADEPRPIITHDENGNTEYEEFNKYDFLERDDAGEYFWNDQFLFSCDMTTPLAANREAMWQETRMNLQTGAFGDPADPNTLIMFWSKMEQLHYPGAAEVKKQLEERLEEQKAAAMAQQQAQIQAQSMQRQAGMQRQLEMNTIRQAQQDAMRDARNNSFSG